MKRCRICGVEKSIDEFWRANACKDGHRGECKACATEYRKSRYNSVASVAKAKQWRLDNPEKYREYQRKWNASPEGKASGRKGHLRRTYGMTEEGRDALLASQDGLCAMCRTDDEPLQVDHDHLTGEVRGILCFSCNLALGNLKDSAVRAEAALRYLKNNGK